MVSAPAVLLHAPDALSHYPEVKSMNPSIDADGSDPVPASTHADTTASSSPTVAARALSAPATVDRTARTVEVVWSTTSATITRSVDNLILPVAASPGTSAI